jgi:prephenate dehydrogenase
VQNLLIIGLGLIGGSIAKTLKSKNHNIKISAIDSNKASLDSAFSANIIDQIIDINSDLSLYDLIIIATPLHCYQDIFLNLAKAKLHQDVIISDCGSVKDFIRPILPQELRPYFIGAHPIAGSEKIGYDASTSSLFDNKLAIIEDISKVNEIKDFLPEITAKQQIITAFFTNLGCRIKNLNCEEHDIFYALASHLPQFLSFLINLELKDFKEISENSPYWQQSLRLTRSNKELWLDIFEVNREQVLWSYGFLIDNLKKINLMIQQQRFTEFNLYMKRSLRIAKGIYDEQKFDYNELLPSINLNAKFMDDNCDVVIISLMLATAFLQIEFLGNVSEYVGNGAVSFSLPILMWEGDSSLLFDFIKKNHSGISKLINKVIIGE